MKWSPLPPGAHAVCGKVIAWSCSGSSGADDRRGRGGMKRESGGEGMERRGEIQDAWIVGGHRFSSRLLMGTGKFQNAETMVGGVLASGEQIVTVALRRVGRNPQEDAM